MIHLNVIFHAVVSNIDWSKFETRSSSLRNLEKVNYLYYDNNHITVSQMEWIYSLLI